MKAFLSIISLIIFTQGALASDFKNADQLESPTELKQEIIKIAESFMGMGDPDDSLQDQLNPYVDKLQELSPQKPIAERLDLLAGRWQQIWGPYEYRKNDGSVDPTLDPEKIFQVVSKDGYYYNVSNNFRKGTQETKSTGLLRGEFKPQDGNLIKVRFTNLYKIVGVPPAGLSYTDLPELAEKKLVAGLETVLPSFLVKCFFGGGQLDEVYTDDELRIAYGNGDDDDGRPTLYIMKRVP